jgi:hypothetical protein
MSYKHSRLQYIYRWSRSIEGYLISGNEVGNKYKGMSSPIRRIISNII